MSSIVTLVPLAVEPAAVFDLAPAIERVFGLQCRLRHLAVDMSAAYDPFRGQYRSAFVLDALSALHSRTLGVTEVDLFAPALTFVFGEAQVNGRCAVVSSWRLREELYGLPSDRALTAERLRKEAVHELGHTFGLRHCDDWTCVMHSTHTVERLDLKTDRLCERCAFRLSAVQHRHSPAMS